MKKPLLSALPLGRVHLWFMRMERRGKEGPEPWCSWHQDAPRDFSFPGARGIAAGRSAIRWGSHSLGTRRLYVQPRLGCCKNQ